MTQDRPALLMLCQTLPFPPDGGVNIRTFNVLKLLAGTYDVDAMFFFRRGVADSVESRLAGIQPFVRSSAAFPVDQEFSRVRLVRDHLASTLSQTVYTRAMYDSRPFRTRVRELLSKRSYVIAHADSLDLSSYLPEITDIPVVCVHHNVESALLDRRAAMQTSSAKRRYLAFQASLMEREERAWAPRVALNAVCSPEDRDRLLRIAPGAQVAVVPNGVDVGTFQPVHEERRGIVFVGGMTWFPNRDGLEFFADDILPALQQLGHVPRVTWVGRALPGAVERYGELGITLTGYVEDVRPYVQSAACFVVPLRVGGGTRLKVLDAWAMGKAVVSTSIGCEGLDARDGWNILVRDDPRAFAQAIVQVLKDDALQQRLGKNARTTAVEKYSWEGIGVDMLAAYRQVEGNG